MPQDHSQANEAALNLSGEGAEHDCNLEGLSWRVLEVLESAHLKASTFGRGAALRKQMLALAGLTTDRRTPKRVGGCDRT